MAVLEASTGQDSESDFKPSPSRGCSQDEQQTPSPVELSSRGLTAGSRPRLSPGQRGGVQAPRAEPRALVLRGRLRRNCLHAFVEGGPGLALRLFLLSVSVARGQRRVRRPSRGGQGRAPHGEDGAPRAKSRSETRCCPGVMMGRRGTVLPSGTAPWVLCREKLPQVLGGPEREGGDATRGPPRQGFSTGVWLGQGQRGVGWGLTGASHGAGDSPPVPGSPEPTQRCSPDGHATAWRHRGPCPTRALGGELVSRGMERHRDLLGTVAALTSRGRGNWRPQALCSAVAPLDRQPLPSCHQLSPARGRVTAAGRGMGNGQLRSQESRLGVGGS